jgi:hypothetical protein
MFQELYLSSASTQEIQKKFTRDLIVRYLKRKDYRMAYLAWAGFFEEACPFWSTPELISASSCAQSKQIPWICADRAIEVLPFFTH